MGVRKRCPRQIVEGVMKCPDCGTDMWGLQYRGTTEDYDGVSEWVCPEKTCGVRLGRWTGRRLAGNDLEARYGAKRFPVFGGL